MADNTSYAPDPLDFNQCDTPRGMEYYNFDILTEYQQRCLNRHKAETIRDNQKYLYKNPEIRAVLQLIIRKLFLERPSHDIENFVGRYFRENWEQITDEVNSYVKALPGKPEPLPKTVIKDEKHVTLDDARIETSSIQFSVSSDENLATVIVNEILDEMLEKTHDIHYQKKVRTSDSVEIIEDKDAPKAYEDDDELSFDLGLDFELDFSGYHEEDDKF